MNELRKGNNNCCVVGCANVFKKTTNVSFYRFPKKKHELDLRRKWIAAVKRINHDGSSWNPTEHSRICSDHFVNQKRSMDPNSPSYLPTIFGEIYRRPLTKNSGDRYERLKLRTEKKTRTYNDERSDVSDLVEENLVKIGTVSVETQVNLENGSECTDVHFNFELIQIDVNNKMTQANIPLHKTNPLKETCEIACGPDSSNSIVCIDGFHGFSSIKSEEQLTSLTGLVNFCTFSLFLQLLSSEFHGNEKMSIENKLLIFLFKMKCGLSYTAISTLFNIHRTTVSRIFKNVLISLHKKTQNFVFWPSKEAVFNTLPPAFHLNYPDCRVIIDCSEIRIEQPKKIDDRIYTYSQYKHGYTFKFLVGISPNGFISFISKCYGGRTHDTFITNDCNILKLLEPGDQILADKGFPGIQTENNSVIVLPPFVHNGKLSEEEVVETYNIASVRIHVERSIQRIKVHNILNKIPVDLFPYINEIVFMCCVLANMQPPIFVKKENSN